jgi:hypothetical protein
MARRVRHYSDIENYASYFREHDEAPKTLCNRVMTWNYIFTSITENVTCSRCNAKLAKLGMMAGQANGGVLTVLKPSDVDCGDKHHEAWLARLGIG